MSTAHNESSSSISDRIRALEGAGFTDKFIKKRVPSYAAQAATIGNSLQQNYTVNNVNFVNGKTSSAKIYQNPANFIQTHSGSSFNSSLSSPPTRGHSDPEQDQEQHHGPDEPENESINEPSIEVDHENETLQFSINKLNDFDKNLSLVKTNSNSTEFLNEQTTKLTQLNNYLMPSELIHRSPSIDSIESEFNIGLRGAAFANELLDTKKTLRKVSINKDRDFSYSNQAPLDTISNNSSQDATSRNDDSSSTIQIPISIPIGNSSSLLKYEKSSASVSSSNSFSNHKQTDSVSIEDQIKKIRVTDYESQYVHQYSHSINTAPRLTSQGISPASSHVSLNKMNAWNDHEHSASPSTSISNNNYNVNEQSVDTKPVSPANSSYASYSINKTNNNNYNLTNSNSHNRLLIFNSEYTRGMNQAQIHNDHFSCWNCDLSLTGSRYILKDEHPYCIKCYEELFAHDCEECKKKIGTDSKDLSYKEKHWHEKCFFCHVCKLPLVDKPFGSKNDSLYCGECYNQAFASRCDKCAQIFKPGMKKMEYKGQQFHEACFLCFSCNTAIGTKSFIPKDNKIFCVPCYEQNFATKCTKCSKVISQGGVSYKNQPYHRECFNCTNCQQSLAGQRFTSRDDHPYCSECFGKLFAKKCFACHKPITGIGGTKYISFEDRHWHNDCFVCNQCHSSLVGRGFLTDAMDILCPDCGKN